MFDFFKIYEDSPAGQSHIYKQKKRNIEISLLTFIPGPGETKKINNNNQEVKQKSIRREVK